MHDELSIGMADVWLASDFGGAAMRMELCPYCGEREQVRGLPPHEGSLHERIRALEMERDALKARVAELECDG